MKVPNAVEATILQRIIDEYLDGSEYHLFQNDVISDLGADGLPEAVLADFTEADFDGYAPLPAGTWGGITLGADGRQYTEGEDALVWEQDGGAATNDIYGWYQTDAGGDLLAFDAHVDA